MTIMGPRGIVLRTATAWALASTLGVAIDAQSAGASREPTPAGRTVPTRVKDIATLQKAPPLTLVGYGLVIGLTKTGDKQQTLFAAQSLVNMLQRFGIIVPADQ